MDKIHLDCDAIDCSIEIGIGQSILHSFVLDKSAECKVLCQPVTKQQKQICFENYTNLF